MEQVLEVYHQPYDERYPVVCMDEQPKQLISETRQPVEPEPGQPKKGDYEYVRHGSCCVWMFVEPLGGWRSAGATEHRTAVDWAEQVRTLVDNPRYVGAERIRLVCDNLNTHRLASLYKAFEPAEAMRVAHRLELVHTPKHGSWLNMAESELKVVTRQCLGQRIDKVDDVDKLARQWANDRNRKQKGIDWQFRTADARIKLKSDGPLGHRFLYCRQPLHQRRGRQRFAEQISLALVALELTHHSSLSSRFNAFRDGVHAEAERHLDRGLDKDTMMGAGVALADE